MMEENNLLSLELLSNGFEPTGIWAKLRNAIEKIVRKDGIRKDAILSFEIEQDVFQRAVDTIYYDVAEFFYWIYDTDDDFGRYQYLSTQPARGPKYSGSEYDSLRRVVLPVVEDNLDAMRNADEITPDQDIPGLSEKIADDMTAYIINWQDWFYDRKMDEDIDNYYENLAEHSALYDDDDDYADLTNLPDPSIYDDESDVPYLSDRDL